MLPSSRCVSTRGPVAVIDVAGGPGGIAGFRPSDRISDVPTSRNASRDETERRRRPWSQDFARSGHGSGHGPHMARGPLLVGKGL